MNKEADRRIQNLHAGKKVYQFEATYPYAYVNEYDSTIEAAKAVSVEPREVYDCCMSRTDLAGGYDWILKSSMQKKKPLEQVGMYLLIYDSLFRIIDFFLCWQFNPSC